MSDVTNEDVRRLEIRRELLDAVVSPESVIRFDIGSVPDDLAEAAKTVDGWCEFESSVTTIVFARDCLPGTVGGSDLSIRLNQAIAAEAAKTGASRDETIQALAVAMLRICAGAF